MRPSTASSIRCTRPPTCSRSTRRDRWIAAILPADGTLSSGIRIPPAVLHPFISRTRRPLGSTFTLHTARMRLPSRISTERVTHALHTAIVISGCSLPIGSGRLARMLLRQLSQVSIRQLVEPPVFLAPQLTSRSVILMEALGKNSAKAGPTGIPRRAPIARPITSAGRIFPCVDRLGCWATPSPIHRPSRTPGRVRPSRMAGYTTPRRQASTWSPARSASRTTRWAVRLACLVFRSLPRMPSPTAGRARHSKTGRCTGRRRRASTGCRG